MWINENTLKVYRLHSEIRSDFPQVSMPASMNDEMLAHHGVFPVTATPQPESDPITQTAQMHRDNLGFADNKYGSTHTVQTNAQAFAVVVISSSS